MGRDIVATEIVAGESDAMLPEAVIGAGPNARLAYEEFFAGLDSSHTARAYRHAVHRFLRWCSAAEITLLNVTPGIVAAYIKNLQAEIKTCRGQSPRFRPSSKPTRKLHLAALRHLFDKLVQRHAILLNPAMSVRGPKHSVSSGKTPAMEAKQIRTLLSSIAIVGKNGQPDLAGLRDRAIIATLVYTAARVGAVAKLRCEDFFTDGRQWYLRLDEKGGKERSIPCQTDLQRYLEEYVGQTGWRESGPLFVSLGKKMKAVSEGAVTGNDLFRMFKRRLRAAGITYKALTCHSLRAYTATNLLEQGLELSDVQCLLGHSDPRTTTLYDRRELAVTRNIVERIKI